MFNRELCIRNIELLLEQKKTKPSEIDTKAGVSAGYTTRLMKEDSKVVPGIEYLMAAANVLGININILVSVDLRALNAAERYLVEVEEKLFADTNAGKLNWNVFTVTDMMKPEGIYYLFSSMLPIMNKVIKVKSKSEIICKSKFSSDEYVSVVGGCIYAELPNEIAFVVIPIRVEGTSETGFNYTSYGYEIYMVIKKDKVKGLAQVLRDSVGYKTVDSMYDLVIKKNEKSILDDDTKSLLNDFLSM